MRTHSATGESPTGGGIMTPGVKLLWLLPIMGFRLSPRRPNFLVPPAS